MIEHQNCIIIRRTQLEKDKLIFFDIIKIILFIVKILIIIVEMYGSGHQKIVYTNGWQPNLHDQLLTLNI